MKAWGMVAVLIAGVGTSARAQTPAIAVGSTPEQSVRLAGVQALLPLDPAWSWRVDSWMEGAELVLRVVAADAAAELRPVKTPKPPVAEARATFDGNRDLQRLTIRHTMRTGVRVAPQASAADRTAAVSGARFAPDASARVLTAAQSRSWAALGEQVGIAEPPAFVWRRTATGDERAVWEVRITATRRGTTAVFLATLDAADGTLLELVRQAAR